MAQYPRIHGLRSVLQLPILTMHRTKLLEFLRSLQGSIFHITWIKKNGDIRSANARMKVKRHLKGTGRSIAKPDNSYITIWLMGNNGGYRTLNLDTVLQVRGHGRIYNIKPQPITELIDLTTTTSNQPDNIVSMA